MRARCSSMQTSSSTANDARVEEVPVEEHHTERACISPDREPYEEVDLDHDVAHVDHIALLQPGEVVERCSRTPAYGRSCRAARAAPRAAARRTARHAARCCPSARGRTASSPPSPRCGGAWRTFHQVEDLRRFRFRARVLRSAGVIACSSCSGAGSRGRCGQDSELGADGFVDAVGGGAGEVGEVVVALVQDAREAGESSGPAGTPAIAALLPPTESHERRPVGSGRHGPIPRAPAAPSRSTRGRGTDVTHRLRFLPTTRHVRLPRTPLLVARARRWAVRRSAAGSSTRPSTGSEVVRARNMASIVTIRSITRATCTGDQTSKLPNQLRPQSLTVARGRP